MSQKPTHIDALVRKAIRDANVYQVPCADGLIKLDAMESPHSLPENLRQSWLARLAAVQVNRYPDPQCRALKQMLRDTFAIDRQHGVVLGNGSDELIQMLALLVGGSDRVLLAPTPTFSMYALIATATGGGFIGVPLRADHSLDGAALLDAIRQHQPACVFLAWPNNPTGNCFDETVIEQVLQHAPGIVVLDEAYFAFCRRSFLSRLGEFPDLMVLRTLSKSGMAGLRLGMLIADRRWTEQLEKVRLPYNINSLTQCSVAFYLEHHAVMQQQADQILAQRQIVFEQLRAQDGVHAYPSAANFILFKLDKDASQIHDRLCQQGVLIKNLHRADTPLANHLRVTIGTEAENNRFLAALANSLR